MLCLLLIGLNQNNLKAWVASIVTALILFSLYLCGCRALPVSAPLTSNAVSPTLNGLTGKNTHVEKFELPGREFTISSNGTLYFVDTNNSSTVQKINLQKQEQFEKFIELGEWIKQPEDDDLDIDDLWIDHKERLVLAESVSGKILRISPDARKLENLADSYDGYRLSTTQGLTGSRRGELFVGSPHAATLYRIDAVTGKVSILNEDLVRSNDLCLDPNQTRLLVAENDPNRVLVYDLDDDDSMKFGWTLLHFSEEEDQVNSLEFVGKNSELLIVLLGKTKLQIYNLTEGRLVHESSLPFSCNRLRVYGNRIYLQTKNHITRVRIPKIL